MNAAALEAPSVNKWLITVAAMVGTFMAVMDITVVNVALPHMMGSFAESRSAITWVATSYSIAEIIMATMAGWWVALLGRKKLYLASYAVFTLGSILCGTAHSFEAMLIFRVIQGIGGGALIPVSQAIIREAFPSEEQGMAMAAYGMGVVIAPGIGAVLGGFLTQVYGWPWIFYINVPVSIVGAILVILFIHDPHYLRRGVPRIDWIGIALLAVTITVMQIVLERGEQYDWFNNRWIVIGTIITVASLLALVWWEFHVEHPIIDFRILKNMPLSLGSLMGIVFGIGLFGATFVIPQFTEELLGYSAYNAGVVLLPRAISLFLCMPIAGWLYRYVDPRAMIFFGLGILFLSFHQLAGLSTQINEWHLIPITLLMGAGMPFMFVTLSTVALSTIPRAQMTEATSLYTLSRRIGGNIGYALVATVVAHRTQFHHARLSEHISDTNATYQQFQQHAATVLQHHGLDAMAAHHATLAMIGRFVQRQATMLAYNDTTLVMGLLFLLIIPLVFMLPSRKTLLAAGT